MLLAPLSTIRVALVLFGTVAAPAFACSCMFPSSSSTFLHLTKDGQISLPANALGVLFQKELPLDAAHDAGNGVAILNTLPPKLNPDEFYMSDDTARKSVKLVLTPVDIDAQLGRPQSYYLASAGKIAEKDIAEFGRDLHGLARKHGLRDVSAQVKSSVGLFRVAPAAGFIEGHTYSIYPKKIELGGPQRAIIRVGPRLVAEPPGNIVLSRVGPPKAQLLTVSGGPMCSSRQAVISQRVAYILPKPRQPYQHLLMAFTFQQSAHTNETIKAQQAPPFTETSYSSAACSSGDYGGTGAGPGQELILARCPKLGKQLGGRQVRGFAGTLELDQALQATATIAIPFEQASSTSCVWLRLKEDG